LRGVFKQIGGLLALLSGVMVLPLLVALGYGEFYTALGLVCSSILTLLVGLLLFKGIKNAPELTNKHALITAASGWLSLAILGSLPFYLTAIITPVEVAEEFVPQGASYTSSLYNFTNPLHAFFESMSAYTTTGLTMAVHEPSIGKGLLFYRSLAQWIGGVGFIVLSLAILRQSPSQRAMQFSGSDYSGEKLKPNIIGTARAIWQIYVGLTLIAAVYLWIAGIWFKPDYPIGKMAFNAINHAMTGLATGGFSTLDDSIAGYQSSAMIYVHMLPMVMGALALPFYYKLINYKQLKVFWQNIQARALFTGIAFGGALLSLLLMNGAAIDEPFQNGFFQYISGLTGTGWQTSNIKAWGEDPVIFFVCAALIIGGAAGSTTGGIKIIRALIIAKGIWWQINKYFMLRGVIQTVRFNGVSYQERYMHKWVSEVGIFSFVYLIMILIGTLVTLFFCDNSFSMADAFFESASALGTVGLSTGLTGPDMATQIEWCYMIQMWAGRLEIFPVLALFRSMFLGTRMIRV
jgi:trk system potassium uptake protein TrkH